MQKGRKENFLWNRMTVLPSYYYIHPYDLAVGGGDNPRTFPWKAFTNFMKAKVCFLINKSEKKNP